MSNSKEGLHKHELIKISTNHSINISEHMSIFFSFYLIPILIVTVQSFLLLFTYYKNLSEIFFLSDI